jgi:hypothetical protein
MVLCEPLRVRIVDVNDPTVRVGHISLCLDHQGPDCVEETAKKDQCALDINTYARSNALSAR